MISRGAWRAVQVVVVAAILVFVVQRVAEQWTELTALPRATDVQWWRLVASGMVVLLSYAVLIWTWQRTVGAWGEQLRTADAIRIWFVSNLGRYIPGKVWQIGAMGVLAQRAGVSPVAAVGSSLLVSAVNVLAGLAVAVAYGAGDTGAPGWAIPLAALMTAGVLATPWIVPLMARAASVVLRRDIQVPVLPPAAVWVAAAGCTVAWVLYGIAFRMFHHAVLGAPTGNLLGSTAAFTASYLAGFLFLPAPGGIGVREEALQRLLGQFGIAVGAQAWLVVFASRIWLTLLEVLPGLVLLLFHRRASDASPTSRA